MSASSVWPDRPALLVIVLVHDENAADLFSSRVPRTTGCASQNIRLIPRAARVITRAFRESEPIRVSARRFLLPIAEPFPSVERRGVLSVD